eukprot:3122-Heterococcus_DN1.PRE.5
MLFNTGISSINAKHSLQQASLTHCSLGQSLNCVHASPLVHCSSTLLPVAAVGSSSDQVVVTTQCTWHRTVRCMQADAAMGAH